MDVVWVLRLVVGVVFAVAAIAKLRDREGFAATLRLVPVTEPVRVALLTAVPLAESLVVVFLMAWGQLGIVLALIMLGAFTAFLAATPQLDAGGCRCFGVLLIDRPTTRHRALLRNGVLILLLWLAALLSGPGTLVVAVLVTLLAAVACFAFLRAAPIPAHRAPLPGMLIFTEPGCASCRDLLAELPTWTGGPPVVVVDDPAGLDAEGITATPSAVVLDAGGHRIDANGRPSSVPVVGLDAIRRRYQQAVRGHDLPLDPDAAETVLLFLDRDDQVDLPPVRNPARGVVVLSPGRLRHPPADVTLRHDPGRATAALFGVTSTPAAVLVARDGHRLSPVLGDPAAIATLLQPLRA